MNVTLGEGAVTFGNDLPFVFIGGPCVIENEDHALYTAEHLKKITDSVGIDFVYKSSYDKANRTSINSFRGVGIDEGLSILEKVKNAVGAPVLSDVHSPDEVKAAGAVLDILQIPALLSRQTDLLVAAGKSGKVVNIKKGQFMAPWDMGQAVDKVKSEGCAGVMLTERGTSFGYNNLVVDMASIYEMARFNVPVIFDAGHSVQCPGGLGDKSGGKRELIPTLARAAVAAKVAGLFLETHPEPDQAPCDGPNMWPMDELKSFLTELKRIDEAVKSG